MEAHTEARKILEQYKAEHKLIAEKLLEIETLDERTIKSLFETGEMPVAPDKATEEFPHEAEGSSFEEVKKAREAKEAARLKKEQEEEAKAKDSVQDEEKDIVEEVKKELGTDEDLNHNDEDKSDDSSKRS